MPLFCFVKPIAHGEPSLEVYPTGGSGVHPVSLVFPIDSPVGLPKVSALMSKALEEGCEVMLDFEKLAKVASTAAAVLPAVAQDVDSGEVLFIGYVNELALQTAMRERLATFWSTSRDELWIKGKTSGDYLELVDVRVNCEQNSILYRVRSKGAGACHTKGPDGKARSGCYYRNLRADGTLEFS